MLDAGDVAVHDGNGTTVIDLGQAAGRGAGHDVVTLVDVSGLIESDFVLV